MAKKAPGGGKVVFADLARIWRENLNGFWREWCSPCYGILCRFDGIHVCVCGTKDSSTPFNVTTTGTAAQYSTTLHSTAQTLYNTTQKIQHSSTQHHATQHNTTQHSAIQHNATQYNATQNGTAQHCTTQCLLPGKWVRKKKILPKNSTVVHLCVSGVLNHRPSHQGKFIPAQFCVENATYTRDTQQPRLHRAGNIYISRAIDQPL